MNEKSSHINRYLSKSPEVLKWQLSGKSDNNANIGKVVVIPALAESKSFLVTLASLANNGPSQLSSTLVICVINNRCPDISSMKQIKDNYITLDYLRALSAKRDAPLSCPAPELFKEVKESAMKVAFVDASTKGSELPSKGGVGLARKIGMDLALKCLPEDRERNSLIISLDADTLVEMNYLEEIDNYFNNNEDAAAVIDFSHILPEDKRHRTAAISYELFLRYYEAGLRFASSPYAYQTIGSTIVCRAGAYAAVGGMNRRRAGEDFYFLQALAKYGKIGNIKATTVHPSMRISDRVPFGTGRKMGELAQNSDNHISFYNPEIFIILKAFISFLSGAKIMDMNGQEASEACRKINSILADYLDSRNFINVWDKIRKNSTDDILFRKNLHIWFDAFQTFKLSHYLRDNGYSNISMFSAISTLLSITGSDEESLTSDIMKTLEAPEEFLAIIKGKLVMEA